ncbi:MAG: DUF3857 domain-containing protein [Chitinophagaceae bacterium]
MKCYLPLLVSLMLTASAHAQERGYNLGAVPDSLKSNASVIIHLERTSLEVESLEKAILKVKKVFTVLNEGGKEALVFNQYATKYLSLEEVEIKVYYPDGTVKSKFKKKDLSTVAVGEGLVDEGYVTYYEITTATYPVTIEFNYEQKLRSTLAFPDYRFIRSKESVIESSYTVKLPSSMELRHKSRHSDLQPLITEEGQFRLYKWSVANLAPLKDEVGGVAFNKRFPYVQIVSNQFSHYGFRGDLSSWKNFGRWINELYKGLDVLPPGRQEFFINLVKEVPGDREKVRRIYQYMQDNFRYVSIQLGIGGLRPFSATFTDQKKYGDCKALSNYMLAALGAVGIRSHVAIINAAYNQEPVDPAFPASDFNHVILCVPGVKDSIWLECTSSTAAFGELGTFTENRNALLITDNGGILVPTPESKASTNTLSTTTHVKLNDDFSSRSETIIHSKGDYSEMMVAILKENRDKQKEALLSVFGYRQPDDFMLSPMANAANNELTLEMSLRKFSEFNSGSKYFVKSRISKMWSTKLPTGTAGNKTITFISRLKKTIPL